MHELTKMASRPAGLVPFGSGDRPLAHTATGTAAPIYVVLEPSTAERADSALWAEVERLAGCGRNYAALHAQSGGFGAQALCVAAWLRLELPLALAQQLNFVEPVLNPEPAVVVAIPPVCVVG